jgi:kynureninase
MARFQSDHHNLPTATPLASSPDRPDAGNSRVVGGSRAFTPKPTAEGWSMSTAQVFNMVCLKTSLALFDEAGFDRLLKKSRALTAYLYSLVSGAGIHILTPTEPERRGAQLSLYFGDKGKSVQQRLAEAGIVVDYREPGVIRVSPAPLYNSFEDVYRFYHILGQLL